MMVSINSLPFAGYSTAYPRSCIALRIRATLSRVSRCAPAPTDASTEAQGLLWRMKATRLSATGVIARSIHLRTRPTNFSTRSPMGTCRSPSVPACSRFSAAPTGTISIAPKNSGIATYQDTSLPRIPSRSAIHSASVR